MGMLLDFFFFLKYLVSIERSVGSSYIYMYMYLFMFNICI